MRSSIALLVLLSSFFATGQIEVSFTDKDTLTFAPDSSYSRSIERMGRWLVFGTSKSGVVKYHEKKGISGTLIPPSPSGEFRDIIVVDGKVYGMVSGDDGEIWTGVNRIMTKPGWFFDAMDVKNQEAVIVSDPLVGFFPLYILNLSTGAFEDINGPEAISGEMCYAGSGTTVSWEGDSTLIFISGGYESYVHRSIDLGKTWFTTTLHMPSEDGCGPFSLYFSDELNGMIVGGCYTNPSENAVAYYSFDGGLTWQLSKTGTTGYRSAVAGNKKVQFACGTTGIDISTDGGRNWESFDTGNFCAMLLEKRYLYVTTNKGKCIRYRLKIRGYFKKKRREAAENFRKGYLE